MCDQETRIFYVTVGLDPRQLNSMIRAITRELARISETLVPAEEFNRIKAYIRGSIQLGLEGTQQVAYWLGSQESLRGKIFDIDEIIALVEAVTIEDIQRVAQTCFAPEWRRLALIGPCEPRQAELFGELLKGGD